MKEFPEGERDFSKFKIENLLLDNGTSCEVYIPPKPKDRLVFENKHCVFKPVGWIRAMEGWHPLGYKVVTTEMKSLGLRNNPTPMTFPVGEWVFEENELQYGNEDWGGIWTALRKGSIKTLRTHCQQTWEMETKGFLTAIYNPVAFVGNYRIKSQGVMLLKEIKLSDF